MLIKLLLVEDVADYAKVVKDSLEITGEYDVCVAHNGLEGLKAFETFNPDIIVTDVDMPEMSGLEMIKEIKKINDKVPFIVTTGLENMKVMRDSYRLLFDNYLKKPYIPGELDLHIRTTLRLKGIDADKKETDKKEENPSVFHLGDYTFDFNNRILEHKKGDQKLTETESLILRELFKGGGNIVLKSDILNKNWNTNDFFTARSLDVFISNLRKLFLIDTSVSILTQRKAGYRLVYKKQK